MGSIMRRIAVVVLALAALLVGAAAPGTAVAPVAVIVADTAGVLDQNTLVPAVERIQFYEPTRVAVFTYNGTAADNLNEQVLKFARSTHPERIRPNGQYWSDGLFIFAFNFVCRDGGTYMGEVRNKKRVKRSDIQDSSK